MHVYLLGITDRNHAPASMAINRREFLVQAGLSVALARSGRAPIAWRIGELAERLGIPRDPLDALRASIKGQLILPDDSAFDSARRVWAHNPITDKRPSVIVRCADADDVAKAVRFARAQSLEVAVRSGGHDILGASVCDKGLVVDLSRMNAVTVDPVRRMATVQPGAVSGRLSRAGAANDMAPVLGCNPAVGVGGLMLGGGLGFFLGAHGAACDNLLAADIVTADGERVTASEIENADLFWAIRGGGGNFGVATRFDVALHETASVLGGVMAFRTKDLAAFLRAYRDIMARAADPLVVELSIFPERDVIGIWALTCWSGVPREGEAAIAALRAASTLTADTVETVPLRGLFGRMPKREPSTAREASATASPRPDVGPTDIYWRGGTVAKLSDDVIREMASAIDRAPRGWQLGIGHYMHGAVCRVATEATPLIRREGQAMYFLSASWDERGDAVAPMRWVDDSWTSIESVSRTPTYVNYLSVGTPEAVRATYGPHYDRLASIKRRYDPENVFHLNRNIRPAGD